MTNVANAFTFRERAFIEQVTGTALNNSRDYTDEELEALREAVIEKAPAESELFESVLDKFYDEFGL